MLQAGETDRCSRRVVDDIIAHPRHQPRLEQLSRGKKKKKKIRGLRKQFCIAKQRFHLLGR